MRFKAIWKDTFRELSSSLMRFLAILIIIFLGVGFFVGISATSPNMMETADEYFTDLHLMDYKVSSTYGLSDNDIEDFEHIKGTTTQSHYVEDFIVEDYSETIRLYSLDLENGQAINQYYLVDGRLPENKGEVALDANDPFLKGLKIGDSITLEEGDEAGEPEEKLTREEFEVVGFVNSPLFIEKPSRGTTTIGSGTLDGFGVIAEDDYEMDNQSELFITIDGSEKYAAYSDDYDQFIKKYADELDTTVADAEERRTTEIKNEIRDEIDDGWAEIEEAEQEIKDAEAELEEARQELVDGWNELEEGREELNREAAAGQAEIDENRAELEAGQEELEAGEQELKEQQAQLEEELENLEANEPALNGGIEQLEEAQALMDNDFPEFEEVQNELEEQLQNIDFEEDELLEQRERLEAALEEADVSEEEILAQIEELDLGLEDIDLNRAEINQAIEEALAEGGGILEQKEQLDQELNALYEQREELLTGKEAMNQALAQMDSGFEEIEANRAEINQGFQELENAQATLDEETAAAEAELADAEAELNEGEAEYEENLEKFEDERKDAEEEIAEGKKELEDLEDDLDTMPMPEYSLDERADNLGYSEYEENADRLSVIAKVFPAFFFLIAIFISFTTMTRMVDEEREYIGVMKALGYSNRHILIKFITYALLATTVGAVLGLVVGYTSLPQVIFFAYSSLYNFPEMVIQQYTAYTLAALFAAYLSTVGASLLAVRNSLRSNAATLLQPKAPKSGTRIWLEKIPFIWKRLSFNYKITFRNVFRYKSRMLMTILGIAGSTGLVLTGFGISDSIGDIPDIQYGEINQFEAYVALDPNLETDELEDYEATTKEEYKEIDDSMFILQENTTIDDKKMNTQDVTLFVPEDPERIDDFVELKDFEEDTIYELEDTKDSGAYITQKLAQLLEVDPGDEIEVTNDEEDWSLEVAGIVENYIGHTVYLSPEYYEEISEQDKIEPNIQLIKYDDTKVNETELGNQLMDEDEVVGINYVADIHDAFEDTLHSLDLITNILVVSAAALAFIVLYNLTNINVSERMRELSTIKVLGSHDFEVTMYIYRENIILTLLGILVGLGFGTVLTDFIMDTMEVDTLVFGRVIHLSSYLYASMLTVLFTLIVMVVIHYQLKRIDMVEALKTND